MYLNWFIPTVPFLFCLIFFQPADVPMSLEQFQVFEIEIIDTEGRFKGWNSWYVLEICPCTLGRGCLYIFLWLTFMINPWVQFRQAVCRDVLLLTSSHWSLQERGMKDEVSFEDRLHNDCFESSFSLLSSLSSSSSSFLNPDK